jgi:hypothetical protein
MKLEERKKKERKNQCFKRTCVDVTFGQGLVVPHGMNCSKLQQPKKKRLNELVMDIPPQTGSVWRKKKKKEREKKNEMKILLDRCSGTHSLHLSTERGWLCSC